MKLPKLTSCLRDIWLAVILSIFGIQAFSEPTSSESSFDSGSYEDSILVAQNFSAPPSSSQKPVGSASANVQPFPPFSPQSQKKPLALPNTMQAPLRPNPLPPYFGPPPPTAPSAPPGPPPVGSPQSPLAFHSHQLSYMQSDRVLGLLKSLGYATIEFAIGRGESIYQNIFTVMPNLQKYPLVIKLLDSSKTSLMQPALDGGRGSLVGNQLGGSYLHSSTTGAPEQRLLIVYEKKFPDQLNALLNLLRNEVDVPADQVVIECLVVEVRNTRSGSLGLEYGLEDTKVSTQIGSSGLISEFESRETGLADAKFNTVITEYVDNIPIYGSSRIAPLGFRAKLNASISRGDAKILSNPTILVLDGRQALIRIGKQLPVQQRTVTSTGLDRISYNYVNTGIVLNIRPKVSEDGSEVTMQTETIVSSYNLNPDAEADDPPPEIENKTIQSFVRVSDNTPFIIAGLIEKEDRNNNSGVPFLSNIPILGNLFKNEMEEGLDREVIIVLTPHIMDAKEKSFSYVIPKDSQTFDSFDNVLFRNAYRIRDEDLFDLSFATQSDFYRKILLELEQYKNDYPDTTENDSIFRYLEDKVPGEEVIVRRMIWEIVYKLKYHQHISDDHILLFESKEEKAFGNQFNTHLLSSLIQRIEDGSENSLVFNFAKHKDKLSGPFEHPRALIYLEKVLDPTNYIEQMSILNAEDESRNTMLLCPVVSPPGVRGASAIEILKGVLVLKRILSLNSSMPVTIEEFRVGRQIIFPTEQELKDKYHVIDYDAARFFYEVINYYPEFERAFNRDSALIMKRIKDARN